MMGVSVYTGELGGEEVENFWWMCVPTRASNEDKKDGAKIGYTASRLQI